ncbi:vanillate O-demethylase oxidoreductase VanB [Verrucomicrobia bacterium LW23]|nr:vanillate O-demethylase oxidoreductase VanB [Verrucomicrobia bacterium LW23]
MPSPTDHIVKSVLLRAPRSRVWRAVSDYKEFGTWFNARLHAPFVEGTTVTGNVLYPGYEHVKLQLVVERVRPEDFMSFRWHPYPKDPERDYSAEPMTLVEFALRQEGPDTHLTVTESGFDQLPPDRRDEAFRMNEGGWEGQLENITEYVDKTAAAAAAEGARSAAARS